MPPKTLSNTITGHSANAAGSSFHYLCSLTQILTGMLPLVYRLDGDSAHTLRTTKRLECAADDWEAVLPADMRTESALWSAPVNGSSSLWFCYLSLRLLLCRLSLRERMPQITAEWQLANIE